MEKVHQSVSFQCASQDQAPSYQRLIYRKLEVSERNKDDK